MWAVYNCIYPKLAIFPFSAILCPSVATLSGGANNWYFHLSNAGFDLIKVLISFSEDISIQINLQLMDNNSNIERFINDHHHSKWKLFEK